MTLTVGSLFSGVGGFEMGCERAGFETRWQCEIDNDAVSVLERHWPNVRRYRDVTEVDPSELEPVDVVTFGSPCQDMSGAGKRAGLNGERSSLFYEAVRIIGGLHPAPAFCVWENVHGALSSNGGRDFGAVLDALADIGALDIAWRVLDAQWWGVPQRRRRIFLVADFGGERAAKVLFESASVRGDSAACREARQGSAGDAEGGAGSGGVSVASESGQGWWRDGFGRLRAEGENRPSRPSHIVQETAFTLSASVRHTGDGHGNAHLAAIAPWDHTQATRPGYRGTVQYGAPAHTLHTAGQSVVTHTLSTRSGATEDGTGRGTPLVASHAATAVRRLTPRECERLMGWDDDWTRWRADGREIADGPRYRMCGNGVVSNVAEWIARRLRAALEAV